MEILSSPNRLLVRPPYLQISVAYCLCRCHGSRVRTTSAKKLQQRFYDQVRHKWSQKPSHRIEKFPWQKEEDGVRQLDIFFGDEEETKGTCDVAIESTNNHASDQLIRSNGPSHMIDPPWVQGTNSLSEGRHLVPEEGTESCNAVVGNLKEGEMNDMYKEKGWNFNVDRVELLRNAETGGPIMNSLNRCLDDSEKDFGNAEDDYGVISSRINNLPWTLKSNDGGSDRKRNKLHTLLAEASLPGHELKRLRNVALRLLDKITVKSSGITEALVDAIHEKWKQDELVKLKFEKPLSQNMNRIHDLLENRTGGVVLWRSGSSVVLYRGITYNMNCVKSYLIQKVSQVGGQSHLSSREEVHAQTKRDQMCDVESSDFKDIDHFLNLLGPRFNDWNGSDPIPVDADLLPEVVPGYKSPPRALPHGEKVSLKDEEMTSLRRLARGVPPHFALGRNRGLQGLAQAVVKLWERSAVAKIAIKRGVQHIRNEIIAEELKILTRGTLLSRNKEFIVIYRGNDFLPTVVVDQLNERQKLNFLEQDKEEAVRNRAPTFMETPGEATKEQFMTGTLSETAEASSLWGRQPELEDVNKMIKVSAVEKITSSLVHLDRKLSLAKKKLERSEHSLAKVEKYMEPTGLNGDSETINDEERFLFRKIGLSMKPFLVVGTREVFDGTIENMHLHWKYRELVKIIVKRKNFEKVKEIATFLETESGGILVSVDKTSKGFTAILYRGKNYCRPAALKPKNLLTKRQALARSIELQRHQALERHCLEIQQELGLRTQELGELEAGMKKLTD